MSIYNLGRVLPIFKGEYDPTETYENLDVVLYNGSSYVALNTTTNNLPTDENHWVLVALAGTLSPEQIAEVEQQVIEYVQSQGYVIDASYVHTDNNYSNTDKTKLEGIDMTTKQDTLVSGTNIKSINNQSILGSGNIDIEGVSDYEELTNKPSINGVDLTGNKTTSDLGINIPTKTSDLTNDSGFATTSDVNSALSGKQDTLDSGSNIKTINNESLLGSGNIETLTESDIEGKIDVIQGYDTTQNLLTTDRIIQVNGFPNYTNATNIHKIALNDSFLYAGLNIEGLPHKNLILKINNPTFRFAVITFVKRHISRLEFEFPDGWKINEKKTYGISIGASTSSFGTIAYTSQIGNSVVKELKLQINTSTINADTEFYIENIPDGVNCIGLLIKSINSGGGYALGSLTDYPQTLRDSVVSGITLTCSDGKYNYEEKVNKELNKLEEKQNTSYNMVVRSVIENGAIKGVFASCPKLNFYKEHHIYKANNNGIYNYGLYGRDGAHGDIQPKSADTAFLSLDNIMPFAVHQGERNMGYVGGNHGFIKIQKLTFSTSHGLSETAIGEIYNSGSSSYKLMPISIIDTTHIYACPVVETDGVITVYATSIGSTGSITVSGNTLTFTATSDPSNGVFPSVMQSTIYNGFFINGITEITGEISNVMCKFLDYRVSYDVRDFDYSVQMLYNNRGNNTNNTWFSADVEDGMIGLIHTDQIWRMYDNGSVSNLNRSYSKDDSISYEYSGGIQSNGNQTALGYTTYFAVPATNNYDGSIERPQAGNGTQRGFNDLKNTDYPPLRYYQFEYKNNVLDTIKVSGFCPMLGNGKPEIRITMTPASSVLTSVKYGWIPASTNKVYPSLNNSNKNSLVENISFWCPVLPSNQPTFKSATWYYDFDGNAYLMIDENTSLDGYILLPDEFNGKSITPIEGDVFGNITLGYTIINGKLKCTINNYGSGMYLIN